jgi:hypothetical protein
MATGNALCTIDHSHNLKQCIRHSGLKECNYCRTEHQIALRDCGQLGVAAVTTKWLDLGEGQTFLEPKWWNRLSASYTHHHLLAGADGVYRSLLKNRLPVLFKAFSRYSSFEKEQYSAFDPFLIQVGVDQLSKMSN